MQHHSKSPVRCATVAEQWQRAQTFNSTSSSFYKPSPLTTKIADEAMQCASSDTVGMSRRLCLSVDEKALFELRRHQYSSTTSQQQSSIPSESAPEPVRPPYLPPKRSNTPDGIPSWPGPSQLRFSQPEPSGNVMQRSRRRIARALSRVLAPKNGHQDGRRARLRRMLSAGLSKQQPRAAASWRPPMSGHSTFRFAGVESHPFSQQPLSVPYSGKVTGRRRLQKHSWQDRSTCSGSDGHVNGVISQSTPALPSRRDDDVPLLGIERNHPPQQSSDSRNSVIVGRAARALAALSDKPLPVAPARLEREFSRRSVSLPRSRLQSPAFGARSLRRSTYPSDTPRTMDLIEAFPEPPSASLLRLNHAGPTRMSLFPAIADLNTRSGNEPASMPFKAAVEVPKPVVDASGDQELEPAFNHRVTEVSEVEETQEPSSPPA